MSTGGTTLINLGGGNTGNVPASSTPDGTQLLSPEQAATLRNPAGACQGWAAEPEGGPAALEFVVDATTSMDVQIPSTNGQSKWAVLQTALPQAFAALPAGWAVGLTFYCRSGSCYQGVEDVPIAPLDGNQQAALANAIQARNTCQYTPSQAAWTFGLDAILNTASANRYVVLVTDGVPTVNSDGCTLGSGNSSISLAEYDQFIATVASLTTATGSKTFVVGVPGSEDPQGAPYDPMHELSLLAQAGGTALAGCTPVSLPEVVYFAKLATHTFRTLRVTVCEEEFMFTATTTTWLPFLYAVTNTFEFEGALAPMRTWPGRTNFEDWAIT
jgi:hypothetical protein